MANDVTYRAPGRLEAARAIGMGLTAAGAVATVLLGGQLFVEGDRRTPLGAIAMLAIGLTTLLVARAQLQRLWVHNKPYLMSESGAGVLHGRREFSHRLAFVARLLLALFVVLATVFFFLFSAIACGNRIDGYCGDVGTPPEALVVALQVASITSGGAWAAVVYARRRYDDETERIDVLVAEGQRHRRRDHPMSGSERFSWE